MLTTFCRVIHLYRTILPQHPPRFTTLLFSASDPVHDRTSPECRPNSGVFEHFVRVTNSCNGKYNCALRFSLSLFATAMFPFLRRTNPQSRNKHIPSFTHFGSPRERILLRSSSLEKKHKKTLKKIILLDINVHFGRVEFIWRSDSFDCGTASEAGADYVYATVDLPPRITASPRGVSHGE